MNAAAPAGRVATPGGLLGTVEPPLVSRPREVVVRLDYRPDIINGVKLYMPGSLTEIPTTDHCPIHGAECEAWS